MIHTTTTNMYNIIFHFYYYFCYKAKPNYWLVQDWFC